MYAPFTNSPSIRCTITACNDMGHLIYRFEPSIDNYLQMALYEHLKNCFIPEDHQIRGVYIRSYRQVRGFQPRILNCNGQLILSTIKTENNRLIF